MPGFRGQLNETQISVSADSDARQHLQTRREHQLYNSSINSFEEMTMLVRRG